MDVSMFLTPDLLRNPYPFYASMRAYQPVMLVPDLRMWLVFRYDDVKLVLSDYANFSSEFGAAAARDEQWAEMMRAASLEAGIGSSIIGLDPPRHRKLRDLVSRAFTPRAVAAMEGRIAALSHALIDEFVASGETDLTRDFAYPLPVTVIAEMLGVPIEDRPQFRGWSEKVVEAADNFFMDPETRAREVPLQEAANEAMTEYFREIAARRRVEPQDDLITALLRAEVEGERLTDDEIFGFCTLLLIAGNVTTTHLIDNAVVSLLEHPEVLQRLRDEPKLWPAAIEEVLRYQSPVQSMFRVARRDLELGGQQIRAGDRLLPWIGSANRDESKFPEPDRFDITRDPNPHIAFGFGIHYCLGAPLARLEARVALPIIFQRLADLRRADDEPLEPVRGMILHGVARLPLLFTPGEARATVAGNGAGAR